MLKTHNELIFRRKKIFENFFFRLNFFWDLAIFEKMSAPFTQLDCPLEPVLPTSRPTYVPNITLLSAFVWELEVLKVGQNRDFSRFLTNFEFLYYGQHFEI